MSKAVRMAIRESATVLDKDMIERVSGGAGTTYSNSQSCGLDQTTECYITGGNVVTDDVTAGA